MQNIGTQVPDTGERAERHGFIGIGKAPLAGTFQFGYTFYVYDELVSAVGSGAHLRPRPVAQL